MRWRRRESHEDLTALLALTGAQLAPGLSEAELLAVEDKFDLVLPPDYRQLLTLALPLGKSWPNWRRLSDPELQRRLAWPGEGVLFDVRSGSFWHPDWPVRPKTPGEAVEVARDALKFAPALVPVFGHRYLPTLPSLPGNPVLSMFQTDIIVYGNDLLDWLRHEFHLGAPVPAEPRQVPFWSWFVGGTDTSQLW